MRIVITIFVLTVCGMNALAQLQEVSIEILKDTIFVERNMILFEVEFKNHTKEKIELYYSKDVCKCAQENYERFSRGLSILPMEEGITFFCSYTKEKVRLVNYTDKRVERNISRESKKRRNGSFLCKRRSITLEPGITRRKYSVSLCEDLPEGKFKLQLKYSYFHDKLIDYNCVKCYPRIKKKRKYFEGTISSEPVIIIKS